MKLVTALEMNVRQLLNRHSKLRHHKLGIVYEANKAHNSYTISHKASHAYMCIPNCTLPG